MSDTKTNVLVIELVNQQPSSFVLDGIGVGADDEELRTNISAPNANKILNKSKYVKRVTEEGQTFDKLIPIRYIKGCDEIHVEEQDKRGIKPHPVNDVIWVLNGKMTVLESLGDIGLFRFIELHEGNVNNPHRPPNAVDKFKVINTIVKAQEEETLLDQEFKVMQYLGGLKSRNADGKTIYNMEAIEFLCDYFNIPDFDKENPSEAWVALVAEGKSNPETFLSSVAGLVAIIEGEVSKALGSGIISYTGTEVIFQKTQKQIFQVEEGADNNEIKKLLIDYFANPKNRLAYDQMRTELHANKMTSTGILQ